MQRESSKAATVLRELPTQNAAHVTVDALRYMRRIDDRNASLAEANKMRSLASAKQGLYYELVV